MSVYFKLSLVGGGLIVVVVGGLLARRLYTHQQLKVQARKDRYEKVQRLRQELNEVKTQRESWLNQVGAFWGKMSGKKFTQRQKTRREDLRQQGLGFVEKEISLRKSLGEMEDEESQLVLLDSLRAIRDDLADHYQHTWLQNFFKDN